MLYSRCIERSLIGAGSQRSPDILNAAYTATNGDGNKYLFRGPAHNIKHRGTIFKRSRDIEKNNLIRPFAIVKRGKLYRVTGITQVNKIDAFDHTSRRHIQTGDDALGQHSSLPLQLLNCRGKVYITRIDSLANNSSFKAKRSKRTQIGQRTDAPRCNQRAWRDLKSTITCPPGRVPRLGHPSLVASEWRNAPCG